MTSDYEKILETVPFTEQWVKKNEEFYNKIMPLPPSVNGEPVFRTPAIQEIYNCIKDGKRRE